jgi:hypothetical protein
MFVIVKCGVLFEVRTEVLNIKSVGFRVLNKTGEIGRTYTTHRKERGPCDILSGKPHENWLLRKSYE